MTLIEALTNHRIVRTEAKYRRRRAAFLTVVILVAWVIATVLSWATFRVLPLPESRPVPADCTEDQPCWDCATMGNQICGPVSVRRENGTSVLVDARGEILGVIEE